MTFGTVGSLAWHFDYVCKLLSSACSHHYNIIRKGGKRVRPSRKQSTSKPNTRQLWAGRYLSCHSQTCAAEGVRRDLAHCCPRAPQKARWEHRQEDVPERRRAVRAVARARERVGLKPHVIARVKVGGAALLGGRDNLQGSKIRAQGVVRASDSLAGGVPARRPPQ
jgi:hypothetical protein